MDLSTVLALVIGVLTGAVAALKVIAPLTKNKVDDKVAVGAEVALEAAKSLKK